MSVTKLQDLIVPEIFGDYLKESVVEKSALIRSGIAINDPYVEQLASGGGAGVTVPFYKDLSGVAQAWGEDTIITPDKITAKSHYAPKIFRYGSWGVKNFAALLAGTNPMEAIAERVSDFYVKTEQHILLKVLEGAFSGPLASTHKRDVSGNTDGTEYLSNDNIIMTAGLLGDRYSDLKTMVMNSAALQKIQKDDVIEYKNYSEQDINIPTYLGYRIIVDDTVPYDASTGVATIYMFANGAVTYAPVATEPSAPSVEVDRDSAASEDYLITRKGLIMHVNGLTFLDPTLTKVEDANLADGTKWDKVYEDKNIGVVALVCKV